MKKFKNSLSKVSIKVSIITLSLTTISCIIGGVYTSFKAAFIVWILVICGYFVRIFEEEL